MVRISKRDAECEQVDNLQTHVSDVGARLRAAGS